jgi:hypothetical protein
MGTLTITEYKEGGYSIAALSTQQFTFWWGSGSLAPKEYFDVFVSPTSDPKHAGMTPLIEVQRAVSSDIIEGAPQTILFLTLRNDNDFAVNFVANHIRTFLFSS